MLINEQKSLLQYYIDAGIDESIGEEACDYFALSQMIHKPSVLLGGGGEAANNNAAQSPRLNQNAQGNQTNRGNQAGKPQYNASSAALTASPAAAVAAAKQAADSASNISELEEAINKFEGCPIKKMARNTVFADGCLGADIMVVGESPNSDEDKSGVPFYGENGDLLNKMFEAIGYSKEKIYKANILFWRTPGERSPMAEELAVCRPFVEKHIALVKPKFLVFMGSIPSKLLLDTNKGITRTHGKIYSYSNEYFKSQNIDSIEVMPMFHPSYLRLQPAQKKQAWVDLQKLKVGLQ